MKPDRIFIELHDGDDLVLIDVDHICAIVGDAHSTVYFMPFDQGFTVDEKPYDVMSKIDDAYQRAYAEFEVPDVSAYSEAPES